jgi:archaellum biogenesis protein FlaJ (TadC family)
MIGVIVSSISFMLSSMLIGFGTPVSVALFTAPLIASGWIALRIENRLLQIDEIFASFLRSLGAILSSTTLLEALRDMTTTVLGILTPYVVRLIRMIRMEVGVENAWREILSELGSRITSFAGTVFLEAYRSQGDIKGSGNALGDIIDAVMRGRKREIQMARSYEATAIMLTALVSAIMGFVISLVGILTYYISSLGGTIFSIAAVSPYLMDLLSYITIVIISIVNGLVVRSTYPGSLYSATYHIGIFIVVGYTSYQASIIASDMIIRSFLTELPKIPGF